MNGRAGFVWSERQHFTRYIEEMGIPCEIITPQMLAAPFFRPEISCLIIPTGFANPAYSSILPAVRASSPRIRSFVEKGGNLLVFGAATDRPDAYDWLPFPITYAHSYAPRPVTCTPSATSAKIIEDYDASCIECDGSFTTYDAECTGSSGNQAVLLQQQVGKGTIVVTCIHEYPSRAFLTDFINSGSLLRF